jgi:hypothetical protein
MPFPLASVQALEGCDVSSAQAARASALDGGASVARRLTAVRASRSFEELRWRFRNDNCMLSRVGRIEDCPVGEHPHVVMSNARNRSWTGMTGQPQPDRRRQEAPVPHTALQRTPLAQSMNSTARVWTAHPRRLPAMTRKKGPKKRPEGHVTQNPIPWPTSRYPHDRPRHASVSQEARLNAMNPSRTDLTRNTAHKDGQRWGTRSGVAGATPPDTLRREPALPARRRVRRRVLRRSIRRSGRAWGRVRAAGPA